MSEILEKWLAGEGLPGTLAIDGHLHIGEWPHAATFRDADEAVEECAFFMDANGIDAGCIQSGGCMWPGTDYRLGNDFLLEVCGRLPDRLIPFMSVNAVDKKENILAELGRMYQAGVRCIKLLNSYQENYPGDGPNLMALYEYAAENRMLVFNHAWDPAALEKIADTFPDTYFICGHYGNGYDELLRTKKNVYSNIWGVGSLGWLDRGYENAGTSKLILGSDGFLNPISVGIGPVVFAPIPDDEKRMILGLTQARLLDEVGALPASIRETYGL